MTPIFLDFDGTIVDIWRRYYRIFCDFYEIDIDFELYKNEKRTLQNDLYLTKKFTDVKRFCEYKYYKKSHLEDLNYLRFDSVILENRDIRDYNILTYRNNPDNLFNQIDYLRLKVDLNKVIVLKSGKITKKDYLVSFPGSVIVGDSESEYACAENKSLTVYLVKTGLRDVERFEIKPNVYIIKDINAFIKINSVIY